MCDHSAAYRSFDGPFTYTNARGADCHKERE